MQPQESYSRYLAEKRVRDLQAEVASLIFERDNLTLRLFPTLECDYWLKIGALETRLDEIKLATRRAELQLQLVDAALSNGRTPDLAQIASALDEKFGPDAAEIDEKVFKILAAIRFEISSNQTTRPTIGHISSQDERNYREIIKLAHPLLYPNAPETFFDLFQLAPPAFQNGNAQTLQALALVLDELSRKRAFRTLGAERYVAGVQNGERQEEIRAGVLAELAALYTAFPRRTSRKRAARDLRKTFHYVASVDIFLAEAERLESIRDELTAEIAPLKAAESYRRQAFLNDAQAVASRVQKFATRLERETKRLRRLERKIAERLSPDAPADLPVEAASPLQPAPSQAVSLLETNVAGLGYVDRFWEIERETQVGDLLRLVREPQNPFDSFAVALFDAKNRKLGYIPRKENKVVAKLLDAQKNLYAEVTVKAQLDKTTIHYPHPFDDADAFTKDLKSGLIVKVDWRAYRFALPAARFNLYVRVYLDD